jgi:hypothetical protein
VCQEVWIQSAFSGFVGVSNTNSSSGRPFPGLGVLSATTSLMPGTIDFSNLRYAQALAGAIPTMVIHNIGT